MALARFGSVGPSTPALAPATQAPSGSDEAAVDGSPAAIQADHYDAGRAPSSWHEGGLERGLARRQAAAEPARTGGGAYDQQLSDLNALIRDGGRANEKKILARLRSACAPELNALVGAISLRALFDVVENHFLGPQNRTALFGLLAKERLSELSVENRARIVRELQIGRTGSLAEESIRDVFLGTKARALTELKNLVDASDDYHDLAQLIYHDIDSHAARAAIIAHIGAEAQGCPAGELKVLSDIDDTFYPNWKDRSFPAKTLYPGVRQFYAELDRGPGEGRLGDLVFITARPGDRPGVVESMTRAMLRGYGMRATVLTGDLPSSVNNGQIAAKKVENFAQYQKLFPEYRYVFVGDSGQGDIVAGQAMMKELPSGFPCAFIHDVVDMPSEQREALRRESVLVFDSYVDAAAEAFKRGLVGKEGVERVIASAEADMARVHFDNDAQKQGRQRELAEAIVRARSAVQ